MVSGIVGWALPEEGWADNTEGVPTRTDTFESRERAWPHSGRLFSSWNSWVTSKDFFRSCFGCPPLFLEGSFTAVIHEILYFEACFFSGLIEVTELASLPCASFIARGLSLVSSHFLKEHVPKFRDLGAPQYIPYSFPIPHEGLCSN